MDQSFFCYNCFIKPFTDIMTGFGVNVLPTCHVIDNRESKLVRIYYTFILFIWALILFWAIHISLVDEQTCIKHCGGFLYNIKDNSVNVTRIFSKILLISVICIIIICISGAYFLKGEKLQLFEPFYEGELEKLLAFRKIVQQFTLFIFIAGSLILAIVFTFAATYLPLPSGNFKFCVTFYQLIFTWTFAIILQQVGCSAVTFYFLTRRFRYITKALMKCRQRPETMKFTLNAVENKYAEICEFIESMDKLISNIYTVFLFGVINVIACCIYYLLYNNTVSSKIVFGGLAIFFILLLLLLGLVAGDIVRKSVWPIHQLYVFNLYHINFIDKLKVITFMKRINGEAIGFHYFGTIVLTKDYTAEILSSIWSALSTLIEFRNIMAEVTDSKICNKTEIK